MAKQKKAEPAETDHGGNGSGETFKRFGTIYCAASDCGKPVAYFPANDDYYDEDTTLYCYADAKALDRVES